MVAFAVKAKTRNVLLQCSGSFAVSLARDVHRPVFKAGSVNVGVISLRWDQS
jgi:hypothetical protein